ncbi:MAG TPA: DUF4230 domain-containing protein [Gemmatimonadaceae bacterium]|nr:DUF4230 domain-containing protein [Gemmatimonadaceae bacterium]
MLDVRRKLVWGLGVAALLFVALLGLSITRAATGMFGRLGRAAPPEITQAFVVERLQEVAKLVASEMILRDVVIYEQTRFRSTKRALLVATGRVSAGINLKRAAVRIDHAAKRIDVTLPPAEVIGVEVLSVTTYDESSGLLNPFTPEDRDVIQQRIRVQLREAAKQSRILEHADQSATRALQGFLRVQGYTLTVQRTPTLALPPG